MLILFVIKKNSLIDLFLKVPVEAFGTFVLQYLRLFVDTHFHWFLLTTIFKQANAFKEI